MKKSINIEALPIDSTKLCCNFVNTVYAWKGDDHTDYLTDFTTFIDWCAKLEVEGAETLMKLRRKAKAAPAKAAAAMHKIRAIRRLFYECISAVADGDEQKIIASLPKINQLLANTLAQVELEFFDGRFNQTYQKPDDFLNPVRIIVKSLYDLLTEAEMSRIKQCTTCGWVFYDETKNGKRRWCNPINCGTKDKMSRYNKRLKEKKNSP